MNIFFKRKLLPLFALLLLATPYLNACTTAVISGKFTADGRPMIWKVRDTENFENSMFKFTDGQWEYIGLIDSNKPEQIWGGFNIMGFAIMNSASFNVNEGYKGKFIDQEGIFMREALKKCKTLKDFENLLNTRPRPMGLAAHFGVIDAQGGAAFYEVNNTTWTKYDANDPKIAPKGYVLRTNYSLTGTEGKGYGFIRCQTANILFDKTKQGTLTPQTIMQDFSRCTYNPITKIDFRKEFSSLPKSDDMYNSDDLICRYDSASTIAIQGVDNKKGENPANTTAYIQIGLPYITMTLPVWCGTEIPDVLQLKDKNSQLSDWTISIKNSKIYPLWKQSDGYHYFAARRLFAKNNEGITQIIESKENTIFADIQHARELWIKDPANEISGPYSKAELVKKFNTLASETYKDLK